MEWGSWQAFWRMGGYASYIWIGFGISLLCIVFEIYFARRQNKETIRHLSSIQRALNATSASVAEGMRVKHDA